jgi:hypothetical protein
MVSVRATDALPLVLHEWIEAWLPLRLQLPGALVALIGVAEKPGAGFSRIGHYLRDVARRGQMDFLSHEHELPLGLPDCSMEEIAQRG